MTDVCDPSAGLDNVVLLTMRKKNELRVYMEDWDGQKAYAHYASFSVDPEQFDYTLHLGTFAGGNAGDALKQHNGMKFSTYDKDQDTYEKNCASHFMGGFWYLNCHDANPNGLYIPDSGSPYSSVYVSWSTWKKISYCLDNVVLLTMRKKNELRVDMEDWDGQKAYAHYASFSVDPEQFDYTLHLGTFAGGNAGDALKQHNGMKFSTYDKDQDIWEKNCASHFMGGFWFINATTPTPTGCTYQTRALHIPAYMSAGARGKGLHTH
ncbi:hypothetical protein ACEWY4_017580 [Coilia grayii]|uniref:Fibrinogen C-terminal domain-containing protein n=1 Tax=Coilia grayii TaxID=363190 RepID=A0ABD1JIF4_9TELE